MKKSAKILSIILAVIMILSTIPMAVFADSSDFVIDDTGILTAYNGAGGDIVIPDGVTAIGDKVFYCNEDITSVVIPGSVTEIGQGAFYSCTSLTDVTFSEGLKTIGEYAFRSCPGLKNIVLPDSVRTLEADAFSGNFYLETITLSQNLTTIGDCAFQRCWALENVTIPDKVRSIGDSAFYECESITSITIPAKTTYIGVNAFNFCKNLETIKVEEGNLVYDSRNDCNAIIDTEENTLIAGSINTVIPADVTTIGSCAFRGVGVTSIVIPDNITSMGTYAFSECSRLSDITISKNVKTLRDYTFFGCAFTNFVIPENITKLGKEVFASCTKLESIELNSNITTLTEGTFKECRALKSLVIPENITNIEMNVFQFCSNLKSVTATDKTTSVSTAAFYNCGIKTVYYPCSSDVKVVKANIRDYYTEYTYIPLHELVDDDYTDNNDGTHSQLCSVCNEYVNPEEHTFVDGVCVCGAKEAAGSNVKDVICYPGPDGYKKLQAIVLNHPVKLQIVDKDGSTVTLARDNPKVSIQAYDADNNEVEELDRTAAYEVWTISNQYLKEGEYTLISKNTDNVWDAVEDGCDFEVVYSRDDVSVIAVNSYVVEAKRCEKFDVEVATGGDILKVTIQCNGVDYKTFTPSGKNHLGMNIFDCFVASNTFGDAKITVKYKTADGWFDCTDVYDTVSIGNVTTPKLPL